MQIENNNFEEEVKDVKVQETEASDIQEAYELQGVNEIVSVIPQLNYMKLISLKNDMEKQIEFLDSSKKLMDSLEGADTDDLGKKVALSNILNDSEYQNDANAFKNTYASNRAKLSAVVDAVVTELKKYDGINKGSKFYTDLFIDNIKDAIAKFSPDSNDIKVFEYALDAFTNRISVDFLMNYTTDNKICDIKMEVIKNKQKCTEHYEVAFSSFFNKADLETFEKYILEKFENCERVTKTFISSLGKILKKEKETGKYNYVKVFVMNVLDIDKGVYDLEGGKEAFDNKLLELYKKYK